VVLVNVPFLVKSATAGKGAPTGVVLESCAMLESAAVLGPPSLALPLTLASGALPGVVPASGSVLPAPGLGEIVASLTPGLAGPASGLLAPASNSAPALASCAGPGSSLQAAIAHSAPASRER
ncbi:MAG TPA: hypothetical protein VMV01_13495, partial [Planctomycetota bacterium]|nr:hypothetical protein [Planctomycetota bacterium]